MQISCLGRLDEGLLLEAVTAGPYRAVAVRADACAACPSKTAYGAAEQMTQRAQALLAAFGRAERVLLDGGAPPAPSPAAGSAPQEGLSRRRLFSALLGGLALRSGPAADTPGGGSVLIDGAESLPKGQLPVRLPARRGRLLAALRGLGEPLGSTAAAAGLWPQALWAQFSLTEACTGCQMCAFFCPTGALQKIEQDGRTGLAFRLADCTNCRLCQDICFWNAVVLAPEIDLHKVIAGTVAILGHSTSSSPARLSGWAGSPPTCAKKGLPATCLR